MSLTEMNSAAKRLFELEHERKVTRQSALRELELGGVNHACNAMERSLECGAKAAELRLMIYRAKIDSKENTISIAQNVALAS